MVEKPLYTVESLTRLMVLGEGQFLELKGLWSYDNPEQPRRLGKTAVRNTIAEYVAAFANADGGTLVLGIEDDGTPTGHGYDHEDLDSFVAVPTRRLRSPMSCDHQLLDIDGHEILVIEVPRAPRAVMVDGDGYPYRTGDRVIAESEERINALKQDYLERGFEQRIADAAAEDVDIELLPPGASDPAWLARRGLILPRHGTPAVSNAAVLLAGREPIVRWHRNQSVRVFRVDGVDALTGERRNVSQVARLELPIAEVIPAAYELVSGQIRRSEKLHDLFFREVPEYPTFAWQEAIVNAVAHRDYRDSGRGVEVWLFDDRLEVRSPGGLVPPVRLEDLTEYTGTHASRNPLIARVLVELGLMREEGEGIPRMYDEMQQSLLAAPEFSLTGDERFVVVLRNTPLFDSADDRWKRLLEGFDLTSAQQRALIAYPGGFTNREYRDINHLNRDEAYREIQELVQARIVLPAERTGPDARYRLSPEIITRRSWEERRMSILREHFATDDRLTNAEYRALFGVPRETAKRELRRLVADELLQLVGERRAAHYVPGRALVAL